MILKKVSFGIFTIVLVPKAEKNSQKNERLNAITEQAFMTFGHCPKHQILTCKRPNQPKKS